MNRRQFGAMLATATFSLGGIASAASDASAQETDPLRTENLSFDLAGVTTDIGRATFEYDDGTMVLRARDWAMDDGARTLSIARTSISAADVSAETFATVRAGLKDGFRGQSLSPVLSALAAADVDPSSAVTLSLEGVALDETVIADRVTATGTAGSVVPEGTRALLTDGATLAELDALGSADWTRLTVRRGDAELALEDVSMELDGAGVAITAPGGEASASGRTFDLDGVAMTILPPETLSASTVEFLSELRQISQTGSLTLSAINSAAAESGVTSSNPIETLLSFRFSLSLGEVVEDGETLVTGFETSGTLAELVQVLGQRAGDADATAEDLPKKVVVSHPDPESVEGPDDYVDYVFEVDGDLVELEPNEDRAHAVDEVIRTDGTVRVEGSVGTGDDQFAYSGTLREIDTDGVVLRTEER